MKKLSANASRGHEGLLHHQPVQLWDLKSKELRKEIEVCKAKLSGLNIIRSQNVNVFCFFAPKENFQLGNFEAIFLP